MLPTLSLFYLGLMIQHVHLQNNTCLESIYMKIQYTTKLIDSYVSELSNISSVYDCLKLCRNHGTCKSVGIKTNSMTCYLYDGRVYAGSPGTNSSDIIYYWLLEPECPIQLGYIENSYSKICTKYNSTKLTWSEAQNQCENDGGFLFMLDNQDSQNIMTSYRNNGVLDELTFLGATDINKEGVWEWFNGVPVKHSAFLPGDPNNHLSSEHCICIYYKAAPSQFSLVDFPCYEKNGFICQVPTKQTYVT